MPQLVRQMDASSQMEAKNSDRERAGSHRTDEHFRENEAGLKQKAFKVGKTTLKASSKILALDRIYSNARYIRPRNPRIWSDVFSKKGYAAARKKFKNPKMHRPGNRIFISLALSIGISLLVLGYSLTFIAGHPDPHSIPFINKIVLVGCAIYGVLSTLIYGVILVIKIKHQFSLVSSHSRAQ